MGTNSCCCGKYNAREGSKIIGVTSAVLAAISVIGCIWELIKTARAESKLNSALGLLQQLGKLTGDTSDHDEIRGSLETRKLSFGVGIGIGLFSCLVAVALIFATKKNNRLLALPFMIWTIITQVACGILIALFVFYCAIVDWSSPDSDEYIRVFVIPLVGFVISFVLNTWWLVVVFNFYNLLKSGQAFDSIPMQTA